MKKFIIAIMFVMMISNVAFGHEYCGKACKEKYREGNIEDNLFYVAKGCAAHRAFQEFKSFEMKIGDTDIGHFVDKINKIPDQTNAIVTWSVITPDPNKTLEIMVTLSIIGFPQPDMNLGIYMNIKFKDDDYMNFDIKTTSEFSGRGYRTEKIYGFFDYMVDYLAE